MTEQSKKIRAEFLEESMQKAKSVISYIDTNGEEKEFYPLNDTAVEMANLFNENGCTVLSIEPNPFYKGELHDA